MSKEATIMYLITSLLSIAVISLGLVAMLMRVRIKVLVKTVNEARRERGEFAVEASRLRGNIATLTEQRAICRMRHGDGGLEHIPVRQTKKEMLDEVQASLSQHVNKAELDAALDSIEKDLDRMRKNK